jgi:hypothetical protein
MPTTTPFDQQIPSVTREQIEKAIASLLPIERVMIRLLMLQYLDPSPEDITLMAQERSEPQMKAGSRAGGLTVNPDRTINLPKEWIVAVESRVKQYATQVREHRMRLDVQLNFITAYLEGLRRETEAIETLLLNEGGHTTETLRELGVQARLALISYPLKKLMMRAEKQDIDEQAFVKERLGLEYQAHLRRYSRFKKRQEHAIQERRVFMLSSLSDEHLATAWSIAKSPILNRRVKAIQKYVTALGTLVHGPGAGEGFAAAVNAGVGSRMPGGSKNEGIGTQPLETKDDLWSKSLRSLPPLPSPSEQKPCEHDGGGKILVGKLRNFATYLMAEEDESKVWARTAQCLSCLSRLTAIQQETGLTAESAETVMQRVKARTAMPRKEDSKPAPAETPEMAAEKLADLEERLRPFIGHEVLPEGNARW